jgi:hypothetical protein
MRPYFTRERFGRPQFLAGLLLLAFLGQAIFLAYAQIHAGEGPDRLEAVRIREGWKQWHARGIAAAPFLPNALEGELDPFSEETTGFDREHSPLLYLVSAAPLSLWPHLLGSKSSAHWQWLPRLPFLACGLFLGASLWYVARRLCGNTGGFIALIFYCFSPSLLQASAVWHTEPEIVVAWGSFGAVFTSIAVAHTLYAPREVVLWNWRRIVLLGIALAIAVGSQFSMIVLVPVALVFLLYVAPVRRQAGTIIWVASCITALVVLFAVYFFQPHVFVESLQHADLWGATWRGFAVLGVYKQVAAQIGRACPAMAFLLPVAVITYILWPRTRYFGNTAPLLMAVLFLFLGIAHPHLGGAGFLLTAMPFLFVFVAGVLADLLETRYRTLVAAGILGVLIAYVGWSLMSLSRIPAG